ncbi:MAG: hypothetical protein J5854_00500 [Clostridia bacterium]|nr:hypothetical protein [Clostridia bacterium]
MRFNRIFAALLAALMLAASLTGCSGAANEPDKPAATAAPTAEPATTPAPTPEPTPAPEEPPVRMRNGGSLCFLPEEPIDIPNLSEMVYTRPDSEALIAKIEALTEKAAVCQDPAELLDDYYEIAVLVNRYATMISLAYYRFSTDIFDEYFSEEYDRCDENGSAIDEKLNELYAVFAASPFRNILEAEYFGEGFFRDYEDFNTADDTFLEHKKRENDLLFRYYELSGNADFSTYRGIEKSRGEIGGVFIELIKVRREIAAAKGYDNYMDYAYACEYKRDFTTDRAKEYLELVRTRLAPLLENRKITEEYSYYSDWRESKTVEILSSAAQKMGGPVWEAFRFMIDHELYDISYSNNKLSTAYTSYLADYESPFIFVDPGAKDLLIAMFHEFGHFTDAYVNYGLSGDLELSEIYSQAMVYLAFAYGEPFSDSARETNLRATLAELLTGSIIRMAAYGDFELRVYSLAPEELSLDAIDEIYAQCMKDYGLAGLIGIEYTKIYWVAYHHFFDYPGYVISYSISAVPAVQICRLEAEEPGAGVEAFCRLLGRTRGKRFTAVLAEAGLDSPFDAAAFDGLAEFLKAVFEMN